MAAIKDAEEMSDADPDVNQKVLLVFVYSLIYENKLYKFTCIIYDFIFSHEANCTQQIERYTLLYLDFHHQ